MKTRPSLDEYFLNMARLVSDRSTWPGTKVGCVLVLDRYVISTGYNGTPRGFQHPEGLGDEWKKAWKPYFCHAEENAIVNAARHGAEVKDTTLYCTISPCLTCARMMVNAGIRKVVYSEPWESGKEALELLTACGVEVHHVGG